jgi:hypothetical protein
LTVETSISHGSQNPRHAVQKYTLDGQVSVSIGADGDEFRTSVVWKDSILNSVAFWAGFWTAAPCWSRRLERRNFGLHRCGKCYSRQQQLFSDLEIVFFDTTSIYFAGEGGQSIGQRGYRRNLGSCCSMGQCRLGSKTGLVARCKQPHRADRLLPRDRHEAILT